MLVFFVSNHFSKEFPVHEISQVVARRCSLRKGRQPSPHVGTASTPSCGPWVAPCRGCENLRDESDNSVLPMPRPFGTIRQLVSASPDQSRLDPPSIRQSGEPP